MVITVGKQRSYLDSFQRSRIQPVTVSVSELICLDDMSLKYPKV